MLSRQEALNRLNLEERRAIFIGTIVWGMIVIGGIVAVAKIVTA